MTVASLGGRRLGGLIGCSGLAVLLRIRKWTLASGGDLPLVAPQPPVRRMLEAAGLIDVFSVYPSVDEAAGGARRLPPRPPVRPAAPCRRGAPMRRPAAGLPRCAPLAGPVAAQTPNVPVAAHRA